MVLKNITELRDARKSRWFYGISGGIGLEWWQIGLGVVVIVIGFGIGVLIGQPIFGTLGSAYLGWKAANYPNSMNTHGQSPRLYLKGRVKRPFQSKLVINGKRVRRPPRRRERFVVEVTEFPSQQNGDSDVPRSRRVDRG